MRDTTSSVPDAASRGRDCAAPSNSSEVHNNVTSVSSSARGYLVEQLVITASQLAETRIGRTVPDLPFCQVCFISGLNGHPIAHLPSCAVGCVRKAIDDLCVGRPLTSWDHGDFASSTTTACEFCGPVCYGGAAHNARVEDNARFDDPKPTDSNATVLA